MKTFPKILLLLVAVLLTGILPAQIVTMNGDTVANAKNPANDVHTINYCKSITVQVLQVNGNDTTYTDTAGIENVIPNFNILLLVTGTFVPYIVGNRDSFAIFGKSSGTTSARNWYNLRDSANPYWQAHT